MVEEEEERISEIEKEFARSVEELFDRLKEVSRSNPELAGRLFSAVQGGYKRGRKRAYDSMRVRVNVSLPPSWRLRFLAAKEYCRSKGWVKSDRDSEFASFALRVFIDNIIKRLREEDEELAREESKEELRS